MTFREMHKYIKNTEIELDPNPVHPLTQGQAFLHLLPKLPQVKHKKTFIGGQYIDTFCNASLRRNKMDQNKLNDGVVRSTESNLKSTAVIPGTGGPGVIPGTHRVNIIPGTQRVNDITGSHRVNVIPGTATEKVNLSMRVTNTRGKDKVEYKHFFPTEPWDQCKCNCNCTCDYCTNKIKNNQSVTYSHIPNYYHQGVIYPNQYQFNQPQYQNYPMNYNNVQSQNYSEFFYYPS